MIAVINKKTGKRYWYIGDATDATNDRDGTKVAEYYPDGQKNKIFIREKKEFLEKFEIEKI